MFDSFAGGWGVPSLRRMFDPDPAFRYESTLSVASPAMDVTEDDTGYKVTAELPGMSEKEIEVVVSDRMLTLKGEKRAEKEQKDKNFTSPSVLTAPSSAVLRCLTALTATRSLPTLPKAC